MSQIIERSGIRLLGHSMLDGSGDSMQLMIKGDYLYVGRMEPGHPMMILDVANPRVPRVAGQMPAYPGTWHTKCQLHDNLLVVNYEQRQNPHPQGRTGWAIFDISRPTEPRELAYVNTSGIGVHRMWWTGGRYAYMAVKPEGFRRQILEIYDLHSPERPELTARWWNQGLWEAGGEQSKPAVNGPNPNLHHGIESGGRLYCGMWDGGLTILDVTEAKIPRVVSTTEWERGQGGASHTALPLPGRKILAVTDESIEDDCLENPKFVRVLDISDDKAPRVLSAWRPNPEPFCGRGGRFGPHNMHENRPGTFQSEDLLFVTFFNAGLQVVDISDPDRPCARAHFIPGPGPGVRTCQTNDVVVAADGRIYTSDRAGGGVHILEME